MSRATLRESGIEYNLVQREEGIYISYYILFHKHFTHFLSLMAVKFKETEKYIKLESTKDGLNIRFQFELRNDGQLPAREIRLPQTVSISGREDQFKNLEKAQYIKPLKNVALASGDNTYVTLSFFMGGITDEGIAENFKKSDPDSTIEYKTLVHVTIFPSNFSVHELKFE